MRMGGPLQARCTGKGGSLFDHGLHHLRDAQTQLGNGLRLNFFLQLIALSMTGTYHESQQAGSVT
jgi:hypothetical protein